MPSKFKFKYGQFEVEYEGEMALTQEGIVDIAKGMLDLIVQQASRGLPPAMGHGAESSSLSSGKAPIGTASTFASKLKADSGPELARAAAASLTFSSGKSTFSRQDLINEMRSATAYFKQTYINNLSSTVTRLIKDEILLEVSKDMYSLSAKAAEELKSQLA